MRVVSPTKLPNKLTLGGQVETTGERKGKAYSEYLPWGFANACMHVVIE